MLLNEIKTNNEICIPSYRHICGTNSIGCSFNSNMFTLVLPLVVFSKSSYPAQETEFKIKSYIRQNICVH